PDALLSEGDAEEVGYAVAGPMLVSFVQWLIARARERQVDRLYFLAREGQLIAETYDRFARAQADLPEGRYLVVSRRAVNVPAIRSIEDVLDIASSYFGPGPLDAFLFERFGL